MIERRQLGDTDMVVARIGFGGIPIRSVSPWKAERIVHKALDLGINFIDTARAYLDSEEKIGEVMKTRRSECYLATKTHYWTENESMEALETSLRNLKTDYVDLWQLHDISTQSRWDQVFAPNGAFKALLKAQKQGKVRYLGVSAHNVKMLKDMVKTGKFSTILTCYNVMSPEPEEHLMPLAKKARVGVIVMKTNAGALPFRFSHRSENGKEMTASRLGPKDTIRFVLSNSEVDCALVGPKLVKEIVEDFRIAKNYVTTPPSERAEMIQYAASLYRPNMTLCLGCGYCDVCPEKIPVSKLMMLYQESARVFFEWPKHIQEYRKLRPGGDACVDCGKCEERCPQGIPIRKHLERIGKRLGQAI